MRRKVKASNVAAIFILVVILATAIVLFNAWLIMLLWGALGLSFGFTTIGYSQSILVSLALTLVSSFFRGFIKVQR